jgi:hypothetical protein
MKQQQQQQQQQSQTPEVERPAEAVAKLRQRLARSLMDLDHIDHADDNDIKVFSATCSYLTAVGRSEGLELATQRCESAEPDLEMYREGVTPLANNEMFPTVVESKPIEDTSTYQLSRSLDDGLHNFSDGNAELLSSPDTADHLQLLTSWRSHEGGLESLGRRKKRRPANGFSNSLGVKRLSRSEDDGLNAFLLPKLGVSSLERPVHPRQKEMPVPRPRHSGVKSYEYLSEKTVQPEISAASSKDPQRWRKGIVLSDDNESKLSHLSHSSPLLKNHQPRAQPFIAPSFLKSFPDLPTTLTPFDVAGQRNLEVPSPSPPDRELEAEQRASIGR